MALGGSGTGSLVKLQGSCHSGLQSSEGAGMSATKLTPDCWQEVSEARWASPQGCSHAWQLASHRASDGWGGGRYPKMARADLSSPHLRRGILVYLLEANSFMLMGKEIKPDLCNKGVILEFVDMVFKLPRIHTN